MCGCQRTRRELLYGALGAAALGLTACAAQEPSGAGRREQLPQVSPIPANQLSTVEIAPGLRIHPRSEWGADLPPKGPIGPETVQFLLVHHTASSNVVHDPRAIVRQTYSFQTGRASAGPTSATTS